MDQRVFARQGADPCADGGRQPRDVAGLGSRAARDAVDRGGQVVRQGFLRRGSLAVGIPPQRDGRGRHRMLDGAQRGPIARIVHHRRPATEEIVVARVDAWQKALAGEQ